MVAAIVSAAPAVATAQLRPLDALPWRLYESNGSVSAELGGSRLFDQKASLAGTEGKLWELGTFALAWRTGRVVLEAAGTAQRQFTEERSFDAPYTDVEASENGKRHDSGDYRLSTTVRLTPESWKSTGTLRFGTRLPTTDNTTGLDRDAIDFFATIGGATTAGRLSLFAETGLGIHTTREQRFEQDDLFLYVVRGELRGYPIVPSLAAEGQMHGTTHSAIRGVENLGELRAGLRIGTMYWFRVEAVRGYERFSPSSGIIVTAGILR